MSDEPTGKKKFKGLLESLRRDMWSQSLTIICYIDTSVLLENIPLVKFIKTTSGTRVVYFP